MDLVLLIYFYLFDNSVEYLFFY